MTPREQYDIGEIVFSRELLLNDGGVPELAEDAILATPGGRGVVVNFGHVQVDPDQEIYLVRFEDETGTLGPPVGCLPEELTQDEAEARRLVASATSDAVVNS